MRFIHLCGLTLVGGFSLVIFGFGMCENVRLEVGRLGKFLIAAVERADVGSVSSVDPHVCAQVEVQRKPFPTALKSTLEGFFPCVNKLVTFEFGALDKGLATLCADVHAWSVGMEVLPHGRVIPEHLCAAFMRASYCPGSIVLFDFPGLHSGKFSQLFGV